MSKSVSKTVFQSPVYADQYGLSIDGIVPFRSIERASDPAARFDALNDAVQRTDDDRSKFANQISEEQQLIGPDRVFSSEQYQLVVDADDPNLPANWKDPSCDFSWLLQRLEDHALKGDGGTRHLAHRRLGDDFRDAPVKVCLHVVKNLNKFLKMFMHFNRNRKGLPASLMTFIEAQSFLLKTEEVKQGVQNAVEPDRNELSSWLATEVVQRCPSMYNRVKKPVGNRTTGPNFVQFSIIGGIVHSATKHAGWGSKKDSLLQFEPEVARDIVCICWDAVADSVKKDMFTDEAFARWSKGAFGTAMIILMAGALAAAKRITSNGNDFNRYQLYEVLVRKVGPVLQAELASDTAADGFTGDTAEANKGELARTLVTKVENLDL